MSTIGAYTPEEFESNFELDFGMGIRGSYVSDSQSTCGIIVAHLCPSIGQVCAGSVFWRQPAGEHTTGNQRRPLWRLLSEKGAPITLTPSIQCVNCNEGVHGHITEGKWLPA